MLINTDILSNFHCRNIINPINIIYIQKLLTSFWKKSISNYNLKRNLC